MAEPPELVELRVVLPDALGDVAAAVVRPGAARAMLIFAHGAGAGMWHPFMDSIAARLAERGVATLRYQFPYMDRGSRRPDARPLLLATVRAAVTTAREHAGDLPLFAGGKSMGGRMTSAAVAEAGLPDVIGLVFAGFPLHPAGRESVVRADHLDQVALPMLFLQGTRDKLAELGRMQEVVGRLGSRAALHVVDGADHGFHVLKRSGRTDDAVLDELADATAAWIDDRP